MEERITREELLERLFHDDYENLKGKKLRLTRVRVPGKSLDFAHVITPSDLSEPGTQHWCSRRRRSYR